MSKISLHLDLLMDFLARKEKINKNNTHKGSEKVCNSHKQFFS